MLKASGADSFTTSVKASKSVNWCTKSVTPGIVIESQTTLFTRDLCAKEEFHGEVVLPKLVQEDVPW